MVGLDTLMVHFHRVEVGIMTALFASVSLVAEFPRPSVREQFMRPAQG